MKPLIKHFPLKYIFNDRGGVRVTKCAAITSQNSSKQQSQSFLKLLSLESWIVRNIFKIIKIEEHFK